MSVNQGERSNRQGETNRGRHTSKTGQNQRGYHEENYSRGGQFQGRSGYNQRGRSRSNNYRGSSNRARGGNTGRGRSNYGSRGNNSNGGARQQAPFNDDVIYNPSIADLMQKVTSTFELLSKRIDDLAADNRNSSTRPAKISKNPGTTNRRADSAHLEPEVTTETSRSTNKDFVPMTKTLVKMVQLRHHHDNWQALPKTVKSQLDKLMASIKPPLADSALEGDLENLKLSFASGLQTVVSMHITRSLNTEIEKAKNLNSADIEKAKRVASKHVRQRLGRLTEERRLQFLDEAAEQFAGQHLDQLMDPESRDDDEPDHQHPWTQVKRLSPGGKGIKKPSPALQKQTSEAPVAAGKRKQSNLTPTQLVTKNRFNAISSDEDVEPLDDQPVASTSAANPLPKRPRPQPDYVRTDSGVHVYTCHKDDWAIQLGQSNTIILADSNFKGTTSVPDNAEIHALPGASLRHVTRAIKRLRPEGGLNVVIQVGINDRTHNEIEIEKDVQLLFEAIRDHSSIVRTFVLGVSIPLSLPEEQRHRLHTLNAMMEEQVGTDRWIEPLRKGEVRINPNDSSGIHYTAESVSALMEKVATTIYPL